MRYNDALIISTHLRVLEPYAKKLLHSCDTINLMSVRILANFTDTFCSKIIISCRARSVCFWFPLCKMSFADYQSLFLSLESDIFSVPVSGSIYAECHVQSTFRVPDSASISAECRIQSTFRVAESASISSECRIQSTFRVAVCA